MEYDYISFKLPEQKTIRRGFFLKEIADYIYQIYEVRIRSLSGSFDSKAVKELIAKNKSPVYNTIPYWLKGFETDTGHFKRIHKL